MNTLLLATIFFADTVVYPMREGTSGCRPRTPADGTGGVAKDARNRQTAGEGKGWKGAFKTVNGVDSMTVIDDKGAEDLLGGGDFMLRAGFAEIVRGQGAFISDAEMSELVSVAVGKYGRPIFQEEV